MKMRLYYIAYDYGPSDMEMIDGPFGTAYEALQERERCIAGIEDEKLVVVRIIEEVEKVDI